MAAVFVVVLGLIVALLVWSPWSPNPGSTTATGAAGQTEAVLTSPGQPNGVAVALVAGSVRVTWAAPEAGAAVEGYVILRDGVEVATVDASSRLFVDSGLVPGSTHQYQVLAVANGERSLPSASASVTAPAPEPVSLQVTDRGTGSLTLSWAPPVGVPQPDSYGVLDVDSSDLVMSVDGAMTSATVKDLAPGTEYTFAVVAVWGSSYSDPSAETTAKTRLPAVKAARLTGLLPLKIKVTQTGGGTLTRGMKWTDNWSFRPACSDGACKTVLAGDITPPGFTVHDFKVTLHRDGAVYTGQTKAQITTCGMTPIVRHVQNTVIVRIRVTSGHVVNGEWIADRWKGTLTLKSPYTTAGIYYCPAQSVTLSLTGK